MAKHPQGLSIYLSILKEGLVIPPAAPTPASTAPLHRMSGTAPAAQLRLVATRRPSARVCFQPARAQVDNHRSVDFGHVQTDVALIASTDACLELASIGAHLPRDLEPRPGLPRRARAALPPPTCCPCATSTRRCAP